MIRVPMSDLTSRDRERELNPAQARYVARVHRLRRGDAFVAFDPSAALECDAVVVGPRRVALGEPRPATTVASRSIAWVHGCPKGDKADAIVRDATELGATAVVFAPTARSVARPPASRASRWQRIAREAARQCGRGDAPTVELAEGWTKALRTAGETRICLDPRGGSLREALSHAQGSLVFAAGPEGGLTDGELDAAQEGGFTLCRLGTLVLRTETVPAAVLGAASLFL